MTAALTIAALLLGLSACASTIANTGSLDTKFAPGRTTKHQIADKLGLPVAMVSDPKSQLEFWAYNEGPELAGLDLPIVTRVGSGVLVTVMHVPTGKQDDAFRGAAVVYVFNREGVLIHADRRQKK